MIRLLLIVAILIMVEETAEYFYKHTQRYKDSLGGAANFTGYIPDELEIVNNGSGPAYYGINYKYSGMNGFNFGTAPQSLRNGFRLLKLFHEKINPQAIVIIVVMHLSFGKNLHRLRKNYMDKFYGIFPPDDIEGYSFMRAIMLRHPFMKKVLGKIKHILVSDKPLAESKKSDELPLVTGWKEEFALKDLKDASQAEAHRKAFAEDVQVLIDEIEYCKKNSWCTVLVVPPVPEITRKYISQEFVQAFLYDNIKAVQEKHPQVQLLSYYDDERFTDDMFRQNGIFANEKGQELFSRILFSDVRKIFGGD